MIPAPIPENDAERLAALHALGLLDTPPEERFDCITRFLSLALKVPLAFITLVDDDRQWFKSSCGLATRQTSRALSFCGHAILSDEAMVVVDAEGDERFHDNPLVTGEPHIRFYAGQPLRGPGGHKVGTVCVADRRPRERNGDELAVLGSMARVVERELILTEVAHLQRDLVASQQVRLRDLAEASDYVLSLLPGPADGGVRARWRFEPCSDLGGDFFGYGWVDPDHFAVYLLDVAGHGIGAALLSVSVGSALRNRSLAGTDFRDPAAVLAGLNEAFPMSRHGDRFFTVWYAVFDRKGRRLSYASGGHPAAVLLTGPSAEAADPRKLGAGGPAVGIWPGVTFESESVPLGPFAKLYVYSDGAYEVFKPDDTMMTERDLVDYLTTPNGPDGPDDVWNFVRLSAASQVMRDDFTLLEVVFG